MVQGELPKIVLVSRFLANSPCQFLAGASQFFRPHTQCAQSSCTMVPAPMLDTTLLCSWSRAPCPGTNSGEQTMGRWRNNTAVSPSASSVMHTSSLSLAAGFQLPMVLAYDLENAPVHGASTPFYVHVPGCTTHRLRCLLTLVSGH